MDIHIFIYYLLEAITGWPLMIFVTASCIICTVLLKGVQFKYFARALSLIFKPVPAASTEPQKQVMTPFQSFLNTLSTNLGNGSIAGMAVAVYAGGPGAAFWVVVFGFLLMSVRFAEVYISSLYSSQGKESSALGGPMLYLKAVPAGNILAYLYGILCFFFGLIGAGAIQSNSIRIGIETTWQCNPLIVAVAMFFFVLYVVCGGARRIVKVSEYIVPVKVGLFFGMAIILLVYHYAALPGALWLIIRSAFDPMALGGALIGVTLQQAIQQGMARAIFATESGLGTAAVLFGSSDAKNAFNNGLLGMLSTFVSIFVCFLITLCIVASGVWSSGQTSAALTIAAFSTVFGSLAGILVSFLTIIFGMGVTVAYAYITRAAWLATTGGRFEYGYIILYCCSAFFGAIANVSAVWLMADIIQGCMLFINLFGLLVLTYRHRNSILQNI